MARVKAPRSPRLAGDGQVGDEGVWGGRGGGNSFSNGWEGSSRHDPSTQGHLESPQEKPSWDLRSGGRSWQNEGLPASPLMPVSE